MDILFFQPAVISDGRVSYSAISNGLIALGMYLKQNGYESRICHFNGTKKLEDFVEEKIREYNPKYIGVNLTWHMHCDSAIRIAQHARTLNPNIPVVFGGFTASYFDREILKHVGIEDLSIIRGDAEEPLLEFIKTGRTPNSNTSFVKDKKIIRNHLTYVQAELPRVRLYYPVTELVDRWEVYLERNQIRTSVPSLEDKVGHNTAMGEFHLYVGKGCRNNCCYCGGGRDAHKIISGRNKIQFRDVEDVKADIEQLVIDSVKTFYIDFDPYPEREFYLSLLKRLSPQNARLMFSAWCGPVSSEMLDLIDKKFNGAEIVISPETGSEKLRKELISRGYGKPPFYSNNNLLEFFGQLQERGFRAMCHFISGIPEETEEDRRATLDLAKEVKRRYSNVFTKDYDLAIERNLCAPPLYIEPCSPLQRTSSIGFRDYLKPEKVPILSPESVGQSSKFREVISRGQDATT